MKKFLTILLGAVSVACTAGALAGCGEPAYYKLVYENIDGVTYNFYGIESGADVRDGYTVVFETEYDEKLQGKDEAQVKVNGVTVLPDAEGKYSFEMKADTTVTVEGVYMLSSYNVNFSMFSTSGDVQIENRVHYYDLEGNELTEIKLEAEQEMQFVVDVSVYYNPEKPYTVLANDMVLTPTGTHEGKNVYKIAPMRDTNISVTGLEVEEDYLVRQEGDGSFESPYIIRKPVDLYRLADDVNNDFYVGNGFRGAYYRMEADIDMKGEQLYVIGDGTTDLAYFCGNFDGNGKTISNFTIKDSLIEQESFTSVFVPYLGLFGRTMPKLERIGSAISLEPCVIKGLTLDNFTIDIDATTYKKPFYAGSIAGFTFGTEISDCSASGQITVYAGDYSGYVGGLVGNCQSYYASEEIKCSSCVVSSTSDVRIDGRTGYLYAAGGIVGEMSAAYADVPVYVLNCSANGNINGAVNAGGIAGVLMPYTSVGNSYCAASSVAAYNRMGVVNGSYAYAHAYAGGIAGNVYYDSIVNDCFSTANVSARASLGTAYQHQGNVVGALGAADGEHLESFAATAYNSYSSKDAGAPQFNENFFKDTLGWSDADWSFNGAYPAVKATGGAVKSVNITINNGTHSVNGNTGSSVTLNRYLPVQSWFAADGISEHLTADDGFRSYGYYLKSGENYYRAPAAYVLTDGKTLYAQFADYSDVAGVYYLKTQNAGSGAYLEFGADGSLLYRNGAAEHSSYYTYDGTYITLFECPVFIEKVTVSDANGNSYEVLQYFAGRATVDGNLVKLYNNHSYTQNLALEGVKKTQGLTYGKYWLQGAGESAKELVINSDGTGVYDNRVITYTVSGNTLTFSIGGTATFSGDTVTVGSENYKAYDEFTGVWEMALSTREKYEFDGKGGWTYSNFCYEKGENGLNGVTELSSLSGTYTVTGGVATLTLTGGGAHGTAQFDENGFIQLNGKTLYRGSSNVGEWRLFYEESISLQFMGVGKDGYGTVIVSSNYLTEVMEMKYEIVSENGTDYVCVYSDCDEFARLSFDMQKLTLSGIVLSVKNNQYFDNAAFCLYDIFKGEWLGKYGVVTFDGLGNYNLTAQQASGVAVNGSVSMGGSTVSYTLDKTGKAGKFTRSGVTYDFAYDAATGTVNVTASDGNDFTLCHYDDWRTVKVTDGTNVYTFNGGGYLDDGGKATVETGATEKEYSYKVSGNSVVLSSGGTAYATIEKSSGGYVLKKSGSPDVALDIVNPFTGSWTIGVTGGSIVVGNVTAGNTASGTYCGKNVTFSLISEKLMSFEVDGKKWYLIELFIPSGNEPEIALSEYEDTRKGFIRCINSSIALDGFAGEYVAADGAKIVLDGFTVSSLAMGKATVVSALGETRSYDYDINKFNMVAIKLQGVVKYVLKPLNAEQDGAYAKDGAWYQAVAPDRFYNVISHDSSDHDKTYNFNGVGEIICSDGTVYEYGKVPEPDTDLLVYVFELTGADGKQYVAELNYGTTDYLTKVTEKS